MRSRKYFLFAMTLLAAGTARAAEGLPQMDQSSFPGQLIWLGISFLLLYFLVGVFIAPRVRNVLEVRERTISEAIATAEKLKEKAAGKRGNFEAAGADSRSRAAEAINKAQAEAAKEAAEAQARLAAELDEKAQASRTRISKAVAKAQGEIDSAANDLAAAMTAKLMGSAKATTARKKAS